MNKFFDFIMSILFIAVLVVCTLNYINVISEVNELQIELSNKKNEVKTLLANNTEYETMIQFSMDLKNIEEIATNEYGMVYASGVQSRSISAIKSEKRTASSR